MCNLVLASYSGETNKMKEEEEYRESKRSRREKKEITDNQEKQQGKMVDGQRANQTAKPLKEGKENK
jgi:hypothetical protein